MIDVRLIGDEDEVNMLISALCDDPDIVIGRVSRPYPTRGDAPLCRIYMSVHIVTGRTSGRSDVSDPSPDIATSLGWMTGNPWREGDLRWGATRTGSVRSWTDAGL